MQTSTPTTRISRKRVLLIEDDPAQLRMMHRWLETYGVDVTVASDGEQGRLLARHGHWHLVVSDIELPRCSGVEILRESKAHAPWTPTLLITAHAGMDAAAMAIEYRVDALALKPLDRTRFIERVAALIKKGEQARQGRVVLAIGAHPDDVEIGVGGILLRHRDAGDQVTVLTLSRGAHGGSRTLRVSESSRAARAMGAQLIFGDLPDTRISEGLETISLIQNAIQQVKPSIVYTHTLHDRHQDHRHTHNATLVATRSIPNVFCYQSPSTTIDFRPSRFVAIDDHMENKLELIAMHNSQATTRPYLEPAHIRSTASYWGRFASYHLVEPLEVVRSLDA